MFPDVEDLVNLSEPYSWFQMVRMYHFFSNFSIKRLAKDGATFVPIAVPLLSADFIVIIKKSFIDI